jgi:transposase
MGYRRTKLSSWKSLKLLELFVAEVTARTAAEDVSEFKHQRIHHDQELVSSDGKHIHGIENFWNQAKRILRKYNGIPKSNFELFLKECEFRFNYGGAKQQLSTLKRWL